MPHMRSATRRQFSAAFAGLALEAPRLSAQAPVAETLRNGIAQRKIPAVVGAYADANNTRYAGAFGSRDASGFPVTTDSIFSVASMTKPVTTVAALQLVEQGKVQLDEPVGRVLPQLAAPNVLDGFDAAGKPVLRPAKTPITLRHLLTHTSGLCYNTWDESMDRYQKSLSSPAAAAAVPPLMFEPGTRWQYGTGVDWAGRLVENVSGMTLEAYFQARIFKPLGMTDTSYILPQAKFDRWVTRYARQPDGSLKANMRSMPMPPKEFNGGGGLFSTAADYILFMQMMLHKGRGILSSKTVATMEVNQIGASTAGKMKSMDHAISSDVDIQPGATEKWGLGFLINTTPYEGGRSAGSLAWAGLYNTFFWIDPKRSRCGVLLMQFLPFVDQEATGLLGDFERAAYATLR